MVRAARPVACLGAVVLLGGCGSAHVTTRPVAHSTAQRNVDPPARTDPAWTSLHLPRVPRGPVPGYVLIADRNNNRVLLVSPGKQVVWSYAGLRGPDDAFFTPGFGSIIT